MGLIFILIKGNLTNLLCANFLDLDLVSILIAYLFLLYGPTTAGTFAFGQGLLIDIYSGGLHGLFTLLYLIVFATVYLGSRFFSLQEPKGQALLVCLSLVVKKMIFFILLLAFSHKIVFSEYTLWMFVTSVIGTALIAPALFFLFNLMGSISFREPGNITLEP